MQFDSHDIRSNFDSGTYERGIAYARRGKVIDCIAEGAHIEGEVSGSGDEIYFQTIKVSVKAGATRFKGECDCPVGRNCKHVVALLQHCLDHDLLAESMHEAPLPLGVADWISKVQSALDDTARQDASTARASLRPMYVLIPDRKYGGVQVVLSKVRLAADGGVVNATAFTDLHTVLNYPPAFMNEDDRSVVRLLLAMSEHVSAYSQRIEAGGAAGAELLRRACQSGSLGWTDSRASLKIGQVWRLVAGPPRAAALAWREGDGQPGMLRLDWQCSDGTLLDFVVPTDPPMYVSGAVIGALALIQGAPAIPLRQLQKLVALAPEVPVQAAAALTRMLGAPALAALLPVPPLVQQVTRTDVRPRPRLLLSGRANVHGGTGRPDWEDYAVLGFEYDGVAVALGAAPDIVRVTASGMEVIVRDAALERAACATLVELGFRASPRGATLHLAHARDWLLFTRTHLPRLRLDGWLIELDRSFRYDLADVDDWYAEVASAAGGAGAGSDADSRGNAGSNEGSSAGTDAGGDSGADSSAGATDWFELELGIVVNGARVALLPLLLQLIRSAPHEFAADALEARLDDDLLIAELPGDVKVGLPWGRVKPMLSTLGELYFTERITDTLRLPVREAARLAELEARTQLRWQGGEQLRAVGQRLRDLVQGGGGVAAVAAPRGLQASLRPYQLDGLAWMQFLREYQLGGILADDMGLGKTVQTLAHILVEKEAGRLTAPALVVAPTSLMGNWQAEAARFAPGLRVLLLHGADRAGRFDQIGQHDLILTTYALLPRDQEALRAHHFHLLILDESQYIKNSRSKAAQAAAQLPARHRLCLTGTPLQNHLGELWAQFHFLMPGLLGDEKFFNAAFRKPIEKQGDTLRNAFLVRRVRPFMLRRTKDAVATELPPKTEMVREVELSGVQRDLYETMRLAMDKKVRDAIASKGVARSQIIILDALLKLRQVCCDPRLVKLAGHAARNAPSAKLDMLMEMIVELLGEGRKILVFSQFTSMLALIEAQLQERAIAYALLTGDTIDRTGQVAAFQRGDVSVFLISLKAGGVGLNLTAADTVIHYDPWWNPAAENQATDRAWRIGQDKPVFVYKLIAAGTLEQKIQEMQRSKSALADAVLAGGATPESLFTEQDLQAILAPL